MFIVFAAHIKMLLSIECRYKKLQSFRVPVKMLLSIYNNWKD